MSSSLFKNVIYQTFLEIIKIYKKDLRLNELQLLICHKTKSNQNKAKFDLES